jgi:methionyl-tRNA formyltransferase
MRVAIIGQQAFGKAVLEAFIEHGDTVAAVFVPPAPAGARPDPLHAAAEERGVPVHAPAKYSAAEALDALRAADADIGVMAYVTAFVPQSFCTIPRHGTIQFHPSLLPEHRGPSAINWAIIRGRTRTGLTIFRPTEGLDEGPVLLQKEVPIGPDDTVGTVYFEKIFPLGVAALVEAAELVVSGRARPWAQDEARASYEGWVKEAESEIRWAYHVDAIYDLVRGCNPAPGAWTMSNGRRLRIFDAAKVPARTFGEIRGLSIGLVAEVTPAGFKVCAQGGFIEVRRCRWDGGPKIAATDAGLSVGTILGA